jgi:predicted metal-dependent hydrolase
MIIRVNQSKIYKVEQKEEFIYLQSPVSDDKQALQRQFERWQQKQSKAYFLEVMDRWYPVIAQYGFDKPKLQVRKMRTLWGSCSRRHHKINLNCFLFKALPACIEYVVLHELAHFIYPHHNKEFYAFLTTHMPDWKDHKRILNQDYARWLSY